MFIRPTPEDFASDEALEAFAKKIWQQFTTREETCNDDSPTDTPKP